MLTEESEISYVYVKFDLIGVAPIAQLRTCVIKK